MKIHLKSLQHKQASDLENEERTNDSKRKMSLIKPELPVKCTENLMCAQFLASHYQSYRYFEEFCLMLDIMASNLSGSDECLSPLGNKQHGKMALRHAQIACYNAVTENMYCKELLGTKEGTRSVLTKVQLTEMLPDRLLYQHTQIVKDNLQRP